MHTIPFLQDFVIILAAAIVVIFISNRAKIPVVVGFLLAGLIIGPSSLALVENSSQVEVFAEIGVVILLFTIGLEFSLERLKQIQRSFFVGGSLQAFATVFVVMILGLLIGRGTLESIFFGFLITLSSTAIVLRLYAQRRELEAPQGKLVIGILLFQDFLLVLMIILTPVLGGKVAASFESVGLRFGGGIVLVGLVFLVARYLMPKILHAIARIDVREVFVLGALVICLGLALLTSALEFSLALGAFLAGIIISESEYSHQVVAEMTPFRDVFNSIFFISIGMLLDVRFALANAPIVIALGLGIFLLKVLIVLVIISVMKFPTRISLIVAVSLAQIGEFSFVLMKVGQAQGLMDDVLYQTFLCSSVLTMMVTPLLVNAAPLIAERAQRFVPWGSRTTAQEVPLEIQRQQDHVIIVGYGLTGTNLSRVLKETGIQYVIIELNGETVRRAKLDGEPILYGDATRQDILRLCQVHTANIIVFAISDPLAERNGVRLARQLNPTIRIISRTRFVAEIDELYRCGADEVIPEEFETSIEIFTRVLEQYHIARNIINAQEKLLRGERYKMLRSKMKPMVVSDKMMRWLAAGTTEVFLVEDSSRAAGKSVRGLDLRKQTGAMIIAIVRGEKSHTNPPGGFRVLPGDSLVLVGTHADIEKAFHYLEATEDVSEK
ncbi:MAG: cation:proton antiporter [Ignavibacteria bacterium]|nr:cation:proton antiporter [Ignavibacteria bacterium]